MLDFIKNKLLHKQIINKIGTFYFYDNFMISEIEEGVTINFELVLKVTEQYTKLHYKKNTPFVFITNRINSYSLDPTIHLKTKKLLPNTIGFAVIAYNPINIEIAQLEQVFLDIPTTITNNIEDAINWANSLIKKESESSK